MSQVQPAALVKEPRPKTFEAAWGLTLEWAVVVWFFFLSGGSARSTGTLPVLLATLITAVAWCMVIYDARAREELAKIRRTIQMLSADQLVDAVAARFRDLGYSVNQTRSRQQLGVDLVALRNAKFVVIECRAVPSAVVSEEDLRRLHHTMTDLSANRAYLVTTGKLDKEAARWASSSPIDVWDLDELVRLARARVFTCGTTTTASSPESPALRASTGSAASVALNYESPPSAEASPLGSNRGST
jgi:hypothetical protein